jgi:hypothetical protein
MSADFSYLDNLGIADKPGEPRAAVHAQQQAARARARFARPQSPTFFQL